MGLTTLGIHRQADVVNQTLKKKYGIFMKNLEKWLNTVKSGNVVNTRKCQLFEKTFMLHYSLFIEDISSQQKGFLLVIIFIFHLFEVKI